MGTLKKTWTDPVLSKVIATMITESPALIGVYGAGTIAIVLVVWKALWSATPIWNWLIALVILAAVFVFAKLRAASLTIAQMTTPPPNRYTCDRFLGVEWRWSYDPKDRIVNLHSFCTQCGLQFYMQDASSYRIIPKVGFQCDDCGNGVGPIDGDPSDVQNRVIRLIQRNLREDDKPQSLGQSTAR